MDYKILALDPGTAFGWALSRELYGVWDLKTKRDESTGMKLLRLENKLAEICKMHKIEIMVFERPGGRHKTDIINHSKLQAMIERFCINNNIEYKGYSSKEIKKFATGNGNAGKPLMIKIAGEKLGYPGNDDNEADALWILELAKNEFKHLWKLA